MWGRLPPGDLQPGGDVLGSERKFIEPDAHCVVDCRRHWGARASDLRGGPGQNAQNWGMKMTDRMQNMRLSGIPALRKSVYLYPPGM